jgi:hypothetical protein
MDSREAQWSTDPTIYDPAYGWKWRAIRASICTTTGSIVQAMLARQPTRGTILRQNADIMPDGIVKTEVRIRGSWITIHLGSIKDICDNMNRLADHIKLDDADRTAMFVELRAWIRRDLRLDKDHQLTKVPK